MAKKVLTTIKLQAPGGQASPAPPVGPALGQHGINIMEFVKAFNAQTANDMGTTIPVVITVYEDRSFTFVTKTPPAAVLIRQAIGIEKGSGEPNRNKVGTITDEQVREIAEKKLDDLNAHDVDQAAKIIAGTARSMGVEVVGVMAARGKTYKDAREKVDRTREYTPAEAVRLVKELKRAKFDESRRDPRAHRASTSATPTSSCAARSRCRTASARRSRSPSSPAATRRARPRRPAPTSWAPRTSPSASRTRASPTSTSRSRRRT